MTENSDKKLPDDQGFLQKKADDIAALIFQFCVPYGLSAEHKQFYFSTVGVNYGAVIEAYCKQRDDKPLQRVSPYEIQGVTQNVDDIPDTQRQILERMNEPYYHYHVAVEDVKIAYFDYVLEKQIDMLHDQEQTAQDILEKIENGDAPADQYDRLNEITIQNPIYAQQLEELSEGFAAKVNLTGEAAKKASPHQRGMVRLAGLLSDFAEACVPLRPDMEMLSEILVKKPLETRKAWLQVNLDNKLN